MHHHLGRIRERFRQASTAWACPSGGTQPLDAEHLAVAALVRRYDPALFSDTWPGPATPGHIFKRPAARTVQRGHVAARVRTSTRVQGRLGPPMLLENPSTYVEFASSTWSEGDFLREVLRRTVAGCCWM